MHAEPELTSHANDQMLDIYIELLDRQHYRIWPVALRITHAETELTIWPWFRVLNFHQGQSAYPGFTAF